MKKLYILLFSLLYASTKFLESSQKAPHPLGSEPAQTKYEKHKGAKRAMPTSPAEDFTELTEEELATTMPQIVPGSLGTAYKSPILPDQDPTNQYPSRDEFKAGAATHVATMVRLAHPETVTSAYTDRSFTTAVITNGAIQTALTDPNSQFPASLVNTTRAQLAKIAAMQQEQIKTRKEQLERDRAAMQKEALFLQTLLLVVQDPHAQSKVAQADLEDFARKMKDMQKKNDEFAELTQHEMNAFNNAQRAGRRMVVQQLPLRKYNEVVAKDDVRSVSPNQEVLGTAALDSE